MLLVAPSVPALAATISGRVTQNGGFPAASRMVSATRRAAIGTGGPNEPIAVEWNATTDTNGNYVLNVPAALPGLEEVLVYTRSPLHFNELWGGVETSAHTPRVSDVTLPGVETVDARANVSGVDFAIAVNRTDGMVLMRDGATRLATTVWRPSRNGTWPTILIRTTYNKEGLSPEQPNLWIPNDYAVVAQDVRGRYASEGIWKPFRDDGWDVNRDGYDTVEWVAAQPWSDGHVGTIGGSALGVVQYMAAGADPPHLDAAWAVVAAPQAYSQMVFQGGSYRKELVDNWLDGQGGPYMKEEYAQHPNDDDYWAVQDLFARLPFVTTPMMHVGGWYDIFGEGTVRAFSVLQDQAAPGARWNQKLRMGPWVHGAVGWNVAGQATYPINAIDADPQTAEAIRWFDFWLKGEDNGILDEPPVRAYVMGPQGLLQTQTGNTWRLSAGWPPPATRAKYYLHRNGRLETTPPAANGGSDTFAYDPASPVPTVGGANLTIPAGPYDQTAVESRSDVLVYTSDPLAAPVEVSGNVRARLFASSSATDTDWTVKLVDVYPNGVPLSVTDGVLRARHRVGFETEELLSPGQVYEFDVDLWTTSLVFGVGHRIRIEVSSSNDTRFDPNPNTGEPFRRQTHTEIASNTVFHDAARPSYLEIPIVDAAEAAGCATTSSVSGLRLERVDATQVSFRWNAAGVDPCFGEYRLFGSDDPRSWAWFVRNPMERTDATEVTRDAPFGFYLVIAAGTDGGNGSRSPEGTGR